MLLRAYLFLKGDGWMSANIGWAKLLGIVLIIVGVLGFFTGNTVLMFGVNTTHNVVHILSGILLAWAGFGSNGKNAKTTNITFGMVYLLVAILGFAGISIVTDLLALNAADNWLHLTIGLVTTAIGLWG